MALSLAELVIGAAVIGSGSLFAFSVLPNTLPGAVAVPPVAVAARAPAGEPIAIAESIAESGPLPQPGAQPRAVALPNVTTPTPVVPAPALPRVITPTGSASIAPHSNGKGTEAVDLPLVFVPVYVGLPPPPRWHREGYANTFGHAPGNRPGPRAAPRIAEAAPTMARIGNAGGGTRRH